MAGHKPLPSRSLPPSSAPSTASTSTSTVPSSRLFPPSSSRVSFSDSSARPRALNMSTPAKEGGTPSGPTSSSSAAAHTPSNAHHHHRSSMAPVPPSTTSVTTGPKQMSLVAQCDWVDRTLWATRQLFGGNSINGFLRSAATAQRIKRQRARQMALTKKAAAAATGGEGGAGTAAGTGSGASADGGSAAAAIYKYDPKKPFDPNAEEVLKKEIMNSRTIKKVKTELEAGVHFCVALQKTLLGIVAEIDPSQIPNLPPLLPGSNEKGEAGEVPSTSVSKPYASGSQAPVATAPHQSKRDDVAKPEMTQVMSSAAGMPTKQHPFASGKLPRPGPQEPKVSSAPIPTQTSSSASSPGNPEGSTLRKHRKKKLTPSTEHRIQVPEVDHAGKRYTTKKEHNFRVCEMYRFRPMKAGDFVAARLTSRDLWILARVLKDYPGSNLSPLEFLQLSETRRDAIFRDKVLVKDVEDKEDGSASVLRSLVLPLPRTYSEAAEWGKRYKKDSRIYAMYPQTTSLYPATVIDNSTYCRGDDDIIVVEFDGEEPDPASGIVPKYHIPARFVVMIPREFPAAQTSKGSSKRKSGSLPLAMPTHTNAAKRSKSHHYPQQVGSGDALDGALTDMNHGNGSLEDFDQLDLDFSKPLPEGAEPSPSKDFILDPHF